MYIYIYISQKITNLFSSQRIIFQLELPPRWYWKAREKEEFLPKNYFSWIFSERARTSHCRDNRREKIQGSFGSWWDNARCDVTHAVYSPFFHPIFIALNNNFNRAIFLADSSLSLSVEIIISHPINDHRHNRTTCLQKATTTTTTTTTQFTKPRDDSHGFRMKSPYINR